MKQEEATQERLDLGVSIGAPDRTQALVAIELFEAAKVSVALPHTNGELTTAKG